MKKYGIKVRVSNEEYRWVLNGSTTNVRPIVFDTEQESIDFAEKMQWKLYEVELYPYKEF
jgi:hypothetical protein